MRDNEVKQFDVVIVGGGVTGSALFYTLARYSSVGRVALLEKYPELAQVNSARTHNSQTLHFGDIETNYTLAKAREVNRVALMVKNYLERSKISGYAKYQKMVLGVGARQVRFLEERHAQFKSLFPQLKKIGPAEIKALEPRVMEGRDPREPLLALVTPDGYTVDFGALAKSFVAQALNLQVNFHLGLATPVTKIERQADGTFGVHASDQRLFTAKVVVVATGGHALQMAQRLGYGHEFSILSVAGSFYTAPAVLKGKVYTIQEAKLPFAAIHGDPDVYDAGETRFGPTAKAIALLERYNWRSLFGYLQTFGFRPRAFLSLAKILSDGVILRYILKNFLYDVPWMGRRLFLKEVQQIVPTLPLAQLRYARGMGGTRPQIINTRTLSLDMGEAKIVGEKIIFNITPSPGASTCLGNALTDAQTVVKFLGDKFYFDRQAFERDLISPTE